MNIEITPSDRVGIAHISGLTDEAVQDTFVETQLRSTLDSWTNGARAAVLREQFQQFAAFPLEQQEMIVEFAQGLNPE